MPKNFFNRIKESMSSSPKENIPMADKEHDFERAKDVLFSSKNLEQLVSAIKYINNFNKKYRIHEKSPEFIYFGRMIKLMKSKLRSNRFKIDDELSEGERLSPRIKNIIREYLGDLSWIEDTQSNFKPNFPFEGKEQWVDVSQLNQDERKKLVDYIREALPNFNDWEGNGLGNIRRGNRKGIVIHCGSDRTDYEPEENLLCFADKNYEEDYNLPELDINNSIYIDGREVIEYINMMYGDEELDESLEWTDKDGSFDGKDKSFENDPDWKNDESWASNPERSYWKQGDAGGSAGGGDMNESQDLDWIRDVSDRLPTYDQRTRVDLKDFLLDYAEDNLSVIDFLHDEDMYIPTEDYRRRYTPEEWDEHGTDQWRDGDFKEHGQWIEEPWVTSWEIIEELEMGCSKWEFIDRTTDDYDLERGSFNDLFIFKRKKDGRYFALGVRGDSYDGMNDNEDFLYEVFPRMRLVYESRKNLIKKILRESEWEWAKEIPGTKEYGQEYRYFEIIACYGIDWETEECDDEYSHFVKIPKYEVDEIWDGWVDYLAGPGDEGEGVIMYAIQNQLISPFDVNSIRMFQGVREVDEETGRMHLEESESINESEWDWLEDTREHANYNGHPQGIVKIYDHDEIDRICDVIDSYNGFRSTIDRSNLHKGLEARRDELEQMSAEDNFDYGEAMLTVSFFVEKEPKGYGRNTLSVGYWPYEVDERDIEDWLAQDDTYNKEYEKYDSIEQVENLFKDFQKPE